MGTLIMCRCISLVGLLRIHFKLHPSEISSVSVALFNAQTVFPKLNFMARTFRHFDCSRVESNNNYTKVLFIV